MTFLSYIYMYILYFTIGTEAPSPCPRGPSHLASEYHFATFVPGLSALAGVILSLASMPICGVDL